MSNERMSIKLPCRTENNVLIIPRIDKKMIVNFSQFFNLQALRFILKSFNAQLTKKEKQFSFHCENLSL